MAYQHTYKANIGDNDLEVELDCRLIVENDGIGSYEFWGQKGNDVGFDYLVVEDIVWDKTKFTEEQNIAIEKFIDGNDKLDELIISEYEKSIEP